MKLKVFIIITALILSGCSKAPDSNDNSTVYPEADVTGYNVTYIDIGDRMIPISLVKDGKSTLTGDIYYYNLSNIVSNKTELCDKSYTYFSGDGKNLGTVVYTDLDSNKIKSESYNTLITSGNWCLVPALRYLQTEKNKAPAEYMQAPLELMPDIYKSKDDISITDIWEYDLDSDGSPEAIVKSQSEKGTLLYLLSPTLENRVLEYSDGHITAIPLIADLDGNGVYTLITVSGTNFKTAKVYKEKSLDTDYTVYLPIEN